jgi:hypothetical protein
MTGALSVIGGSIIILEMVVIYSIMWYIERRLKVIKRQTDLIKNRMKELSQ